MARKQNEPDACKARGFQKGSSGNPKGRPPIIREVQELAKTYTEDAVATLYEIMTDSRINGSARVQAATQLLDRGWGRPKQSMDVKVDHNASGLAHAIAQAQERLLHRAHSAAPLPIENQIEVIDATEPFATYEATRPSIIPAHRSGNVDGPGRDI